MIIIDYHYHQIFDNPHHNDSVITNVYYYKHNYHYSKHNYLYPIINDHC